jgi:long-subunit acyl-CoA synthetase (AMP-forming)
MTLRNANAALKHWAETRADAVALLGIDGDITYRALETMVEALAQKLSAAGVKRCALYLDNGPGWVAADLALRRAECVIVPVPVFFSAEQIEHAFLEAGVDAVITDAPAQLQALLPAGWLGTGEAIGDAPQLNGVVLCGAVLGDAAPRILPAATHKVTFTSGTTGRPKGVCLSEAAIDTVASSLCEASEGSAGDRHLSLMPFAALLENIAGIDIPLLAGAEFCALPLGALGFSGSSGLQPQQLIAAMDRYRPTSIVTVPQILNVLMVMAERAGWRPGYLRHVAVGGAVLAKGAVQRARELGFPVYEGYGLSECCSVVTLNTAQADRPDSVGRPLPHCRVSLAADGEVMVHGIGAVGYLGTEAAPALSADGAIATGDIGRFDEDGFLHLLGRKKNMFITAFGRNVAPDWVESELTSQPAVAQAFVSGEARPWNVAIIVPGPAALAGDPADISRKISAAIEAVNLRLPDYAQVRRWILADQPFQPRNGQLTWNGRLRREEIAKLYQNRLDNLYKEEMVHVL